MSIGVPSRYERRRCVWRERRYIILLVMDRSRIAMAVLDGVGICHIVVVVGRTHASRERGSTSEAASNWPHWRLSSSHYPARLICMDFAASYLSMDDYYSSHRSSSR